MTVAPKPKRDWNAYNAHLVQRGEILLDVDCLQDWQNELSRMNQTKAGRPFTFTHSLILFLGALKGLFHFGYCQTPDLARILNKL